MGDDKKDLPAVCGLCEGDASLRTRVLFVRDGKQSLVTYTDCPRCDRARCMNCREYITDKWAAKCPCGNPTK